MRRMVLACAAATLSLAGCGAETDEAGGPTTSAPTPTAATTTSPAAKPIPGCAPLCLEPQLTRPGPVPAGAYAAEYFFAGRLTAEVEPGWEVTEDSTGELRFARSPDPDYGVLLWEDVYPVHQGERVAGVPQTGAGLLDWLRRSLDLDLTEPKQAAIGDLPATQVDATISAEAANDDPGCPARVCVNPLRFPQWDGRGAWPAMPRPGFCSRTSATAALATSSSRRSRGAAEPTSPGACRPPSACCGRCGCPSSRGSEGLERLGRETLRQRGEHLRRDRRLVPQQRRERLRRDHQ